jgi:hypothetical protein
MENSMAEIWRITHRRGEIEYELAISWDDDSFRDGTPAIHVAVTVRRGDEYKEAEALEADLAILNNDDGGPDLALSSKGREIFRMPLADLFDKSQVIDRIPAWLYGGGDLLTGCLLRAGLSSVVGQVIRCKNATRDLAWYRPRIRAMGGCLRENIGRIGSRTALRAGKCVLSAGF